MYPSLLGDPASPGLKLTHEVSGGSSSNMPSGGPLGDKLCQEITEEFLICKICLDSYKTPKCLNCLHTFCENCIDNHILAETTYKKYSDYREFTCPLCRKRTQLPIGGVKKLPDNFLVSSLSELVDRKKPSKVPYCDFCKLVSHRQREANSKCLDCNKLLCRSCVDAHKETRVTKHHSLFDCQIEKDIICKEHPEEVVRFYCEECEECICVLCTFNDHNDHDVCDFHDAVVKYKENIGVLLDNCKEKIDSLEDQIDRMASCEEVINECEQAIHDMAINYISEIRGREKSLIDELHNLFGKDAMELITHRTEMKSNLDGLRSTCNLTELILKGKDIELLLLKKQVKEKLGALDDMDVKNLPQTISKKVKFVAGQIDVGYIHDADRPLISKLRAKKALSTNNYSTEIPDNELISDAETQTDISTFDRASESVQVKIKTGIIATQTEEEVKESDEEEVEEKETEDQETQTDQAEVSEKAVNTKNQSNEGDSGESTPTRGSDDYVPNIARRRRRRERTLNDDGTTSYNRVTEEEEDSSSYRRKNTSPPAESRRRSYGTGSRHRSSYYGSSFDDYSSTSTTGGVGSSYSSKHY